MSMAGRPRGGSRAIRKPATSPSSPCPRTRSPVNAKRRSRRDATSSTPSRSNLIGWSQPFGAFSPTANDALRPDCSQQSLLNTSAISKGWITAHRRWHPSDSEQFRSVPRTQPAFGGRVEPSYRYRATEGARHERDNLEGARGELDAALGHRVDGGLLNRDYPARASVGKRSGVRPAGSSHQCKEHEQLGTELMRA